MQWTKKYYVTVVILGELISFKVRELDYAASMDRFTVTVMNGTICWIPVDQMCSFNKILMYADTC